MSTVAAFVPEIFLRSKLPHWFDEQCAARGHSIEWLNVNNSMPLYKQAFKDYKNIITWQCRMPHSWTTASGANLLHIDNALINQRHGCFVDSKGFFSQSNLRINQHWLCDHQADYIEAAKPFGWKPFSGGNPDGPILAALQYRRDCNVNFEFPLAPKKEDKVLFTLDVLKKHLPTGCRVVVRPHPRERELFTSTQELPENWSWSLDKTLADILPSCSVLVTVNSTCATEACLLGLPVAVLGTGTFTGSGAVSECHDDFSRLEGITEMQADHDAQRKYVGAVLKRHTLPYEFTGEMSNSEVDLWLDSLQ